MKKKRFKQGAALALSFAMILGMMPAVTKPLEVRAATTNILPTTTQFATKAELMTNYDLVDSTDATVQKVIFGQNGSGTAQEWKIAGTDTGIDDNNIVLFAATPLGSNVVFNSTTSTKTYDSDWKCTYDSAPSTVNANHYGGSDLRQTISDFLKGESYFSSAEQGKMNDTTITTKDTYNNTTYTTTDKLYAGYSEGYGSSYTSITVGTLNSGLTIDKSNWGSGLFWLRAPGDIDGYSALFAEPGYYVNGNDVDYDFVSVVPAFDLNLSSVIFASAAPAATSDGGLSTKTGDTNNAFTLRYASAGDETATINEAGSEVAITGATDNMYLVVQNSTGAYAKALTSGTTSVKASEIEGIADFYNCQVWLESTNATSRITTATEPTTKAAPSTTEKDTPVAPTPSDPTPPTPTGPQIGDKSGWEEIKNDVIDKVKDATTTSEKITITIDMNDTTKIDGGIIDAIKGKNVDIVLDMGDGIKWTINGNSVTSDHVADIDLGVTKNANTIPIDVINSITGQKSTIQISLTHNGEFGFTATLSIGLDASNAGYYANLFYYNASTGKLEYMNAAKIDANGNASLTFTHASDYSIVIADKVMDGKDTTNNTPQKDDVPKTGDNTPIAWLFVLALISGGTIVFFGRRKKALR